MTVSGINDSIRSLAACIQATNEQAVREYTRLVEDILRLKIQDKYPIEHTLDGLLDFCGYHPALHLYRRLAAIIGASTLFLPDFMLRHIEHFGIPVKTK